MKLRFLGGASALALLGLSSCVQILGIGGDYKTEGSGGASTGTGTAMTTATGTATGSGSSTSTGGTPPACSANNLVTTIATHAGSIVGDRQLRAAAQVSATQRMGYIVTMFNGPSSDLTIVSFDGSQIRGTVHYVGLPGGGVDLGEITTTSSTLEIYLRVNDVIGRLSVPTDGNGAMSPGMYPQNFTAFQAPCGMINLNDFVIQKPIMPGNERYAARCNTGSTDTLVVGGATGASTTIATGPSGSEQVRASEFLRVGSTEVIFSSENPQNGAFIRVGDLMTANKMSVDGDPNRLTLFFNDIIPDPAQPNLKVFFASLLPPPAFTPADVYRVDVTENTLSQLWQSPIPQTTKIATLTKQTDLVQWHPLLPQGNGYFGAGADINGKGAELTWLDQNGNVLILNYLVAMPATAAVGTAKAVPLDVGSLFVTWSENTSADSTIKAVKVLCTGG